MPKARPAMDALVYRLPTYPGIGDALRTAFEPELPVLPSLLRSLVERL